MSYTYDANGNRTRRVDVHAGVTRISSWTLDAINWVTTERLSNVTNSYAYDKAGNMVAMTTLAGTTRYSYDAENDVSRIEAPNGQVVRVNNYQHTSTSRAFPGRVFDMKRCDTDGRVQRVDHFTANADGTYNQTLAAMAYGYTSPSGRATNKVHSIDDNLFDLHARYTYDSNSRIKSSKTMSGSRRAEQTSYTYDANSNITRWTSGWGSTDVTMTGTYNAADQMTALGGTWSGTFGYDGNGNATKQLAGTMSYNERARTSKMRHGLSSTNQAAKYEGTSQFERTKLGGTTFTNSLLGVTSSTEGGVTTHYIKTPTGEPIGQYTAGGESYYYLTDRLGSVIGVINDPGKRVNDYWYTRSVTTPEVTRPMRRRACRGCRGGSLASGSTG